jgi:hypothetical protein
MEVQAVRSPGIVPAVYRVKAAKSRLTTSPDRERASAETPPFSATEAASPSPKGVPQLDC